MEYLIENLWAAWLVIGIFFLILELCTTALISIWFVPAAAITGVLSLVIPKFSLQVLIFAVLSGIFMVLFRKLYKNKIKKKDDDVKAETKMLGKSAVTEEITDGHGGRVKFGDIYWRAVTENGERVDKGETVTITGVEDTTLVIKKEN